MNGNINTRLLQVNKSNSDLSTKQDELIMTIHDNNAQVTVVSEANLEVEDTDKTILTKSKFKNYDIERKVVKNNKKARIAVVLTKDIKYKRLLDIEHPNNSTIILKIKQSNRKKCCRSSKLT